MRRRIHVMRGGKVGAADLWATGADFILGTSLSDEADVPPTAVRSWLSSLNWFIKSLTSEDVTVTLRVAVASWGANLTSHLRATRCCSESRCWASFLATLGTCGTYEPPALTSHLYFLPESASLGPPNNHSHESEPKETY
jgi:hypothetical protein